MRILPRPQKVEKLAGKFVITEQTKIYSCNEFMPIAKHFIEKVQLCNGLELQFVDNIDEAQVNFICQEGMPTEGYTLNIAQGCLSVTASTPQGCFYATQSLCQIMQLYLPRQEISCENYYVEDCPKYVYRGLHLDIARHFFGVDTIKQIIRLMSQVKLNTLHLHLTDDQGFRVQIDKYPLLTQIGSVRSGTEIVKDGSRFVEEKPHGGFLTKQDVAEIIAFANDHFIEVIPEIDVPGHFVAALAAYPQYSCTGKVSEVRKTWGISKDILCAGNPESYEFVCDILDEIVEMFPCEYVHLGGDEAPKERWCNCKKCRDKLAELKLDSFDELQNYMLEFFASYLAQAGKKVICWNDGISEKTSMDIISQVWKPFTRKNGVKQANKGRQTIMSPFFNMYFDYPYAMTPLKRTLKFNPVKGVKKHAKQNVLGVEGTLWTEYVCDEQKLYFNLLPRLDALANCAWGHTTDYFYEALQERIDYYKHLGLNCNFHAKKSRRKLCVVKRFFKTDSYIELVLQQSRENKPKNDK